MNGRACCVTGHREIPAAEVAFVKQALRKEVALAMEEGFTHFLSGMAEGADLIFAEVVAEFYAEGADICLEAAIPYRDRLRRLEETHGKLLERCGKITVVSEGYAKYVFAKRNQYMVEQSERVIAVYDGRHGGNHPHGGEKGCGFTENYYRRNEKRMKPSIDWGSSFFIL